MGKIIQRVRKGAVTALPITVAVVSIGFVAYVNDENEKLHDNLIEQYEKKAILENNAILLQSEIEEYKIDLNALEKQIQEKDGQIENLQKQSDSLEKEVQDLKKKAEQQRISRSESPTTGTSIGTFEASAYIAFCSEGCTGRTKSGHDVSNTTTYNGYRIIATDNSVIPLYSIVNVSYGDTSFKAIALDSGGGINGKEIDLLVGSHDEAINFGRRDVTISMIERGE